MGMELLTVFFFPNKIGIYSMCGLNIIQNWRFILEICFSFHIFKLFISLVEKKIHIFFLFVRSILLFFFNSFSARLLFLCYLKTLKIVLFEHIFSPCSKEITCFWILKCNISRFSFIQTNCFIVYILLNKLSLNGEDCWNRSWFIHCAYKKLVWYRRKVSSFHEFNSIP